MNRAEEVKIHMQDTEELIQRIGKVTVNFKELTADDIDLLNSTCDLLERVFYSLRMEAISYRDRHFIHSHAERSR